MTIRYEENSNRMFYLNKKIEIKTFIKIIAELDILIYISTNKRIFN